MNALITFLGERLDEDTWIAREADGISRGALMGLYEDLIKSRPLDEGRRSYGIHLGHFRPSRMLDDIEAKRRILTLHDCLHDCATETGSQVFPAGSDGEIACPVLRVLALPYASHHEYRKEWAL